MKPIGIACRDWLKIGTVLLGLMALPLMSAAGPGNLSAGLETDFASQYTWRGIAYSRGAVAQPYGWVTSGDLTLSLWGNANFSHEGQRSTLDGGDVMAVWTQDFGLWRIEPAFEYWFDRPVKGEFDPPTGEASVRISRRLGPIHLITNQAIDAIRFHGAYYGDIGPGFTVHLKQADLEINMRQAWASATFNRIYAGVETRSPTYFGADASGTHHFKNGLYLRVHGEASRMENAEIRRSLHQTFLLTAGFALGFEWHRK